MPSAIRRSVVRARRVLTACLLLTSLLCCFQSTYAQKPVTSQGDVPQKIDLAICLLEQNKTVQPEFTINLRDYHNPDIYRGEFNIAILNSHEIVTAEYNLAGKYEFDLRNLRSGVLQPHASLPVPVDATSLLIVPAPHSVLVSESVVITSSTYYHPHRMFLVDTQTGKLLKTIDVGPNYHIYTSAVLPGKQNDVVVAAGGLNGKASSLLHINLNTGKIKREVKYPDGPLLDQNGIFFSPNGEVMACAFPGDEMSPNRIDFLETTSGKKLSVFHGDFSKHTVNAPTFFLSNTQIVCNNFIYNIKNARTAPLLKPHDTRQRCVSGVPGALGYAFFQTKTGLELWNLPADKMVRRWNGVTGADRILFASDHTTMGVMSGETLTLWPFDPRTLGKKTKKQAKVSL